MNLIWANLRVKSLIFTDLLCVFPSHGALTRGAGKSDFPQGYAEDTERETNNMSSNQQKAGWGPIRLRLFNSESKISF
jgi:hypothetical protein